MASGVSVTDTSGDGTSAGVACGVAVDGRPSEAAAPAEGGLATGCGVGRKATYASPAPSARRTSAPAISDGHRSVTCDVLFIVLLPMRPSASDVLHRPRE